MLKQENTQKNLFDDLVNKIKYLEKKKNMKKKFYNNNFK